MLNAAATAKHFDVAPTAPRTCGDETCMACCAGTCERVAAAPFDVEALRGRLRALPREELERRLEGVVLWVVSPDEPTNGGDVVEFLGGLLRDLGPLGAAASR